MEHQIAIAFPIVIASLITIVVLITIFYLIAISLLIKIAFGIGYSMAISLIGIQQENEGLFPADIPPTEQTK